MIDFLRATSAFFPLKQTLYNNFFCKTTVLLLLVTFQKTCYISPALTTQSFHLLLEALCFLFPHPELSQSFGDLLLTQRDVSIFDVCVFFFSYLPQLSSEFRGFACVALLGQCNQAPTITGNPINVPSSMFTVLSSSPLLHLLESSSRAIFFWSSRIFSFTSFFYKSSNSCNIFLIDPSF